jgi:magnesium transporter
MMEAAQLEALKLMDTKAGADLLKAMRDEDAYSALTALGPRQFGLIWCELEPEQRSRIQSLAPADVAAVWASYPDLPEDSAGRLMEKPAAAFDAQTRVEQVVSSLRESVKRTLITYVFVTETGNKLVGIVTFRELLYAAPTQLLQDIMLRNPYALRPETPLVDAMREVVKRHFPVYPVCKADGTLIGQIRGQVLFEAQAVDISAQAGQLVGVEKEERLTTPWKRSFLSRHPWLLLNLLTAFIAGGVVSFFQGSVDKIALLAVFLPILAGQSGNTGCQALAVTLRGLTLGELTDKDVPRLLRKEGWLGFLNGIGVGLVAATAMYFYAKAQSHPQALQLAGITLVSMVFACVASGLAGASVPLTLKKLGADPATASSIFLTTATDVASMGIFLGLATWLLL